MLGRFAVQNKLQRMGATVQLRLKSFLWRWLLHCRALALEHVGFSSCSSQALHGLPGLSSCLPWFLVAKSNFHSPYVGWEAARVHTSSQNFGFFICETWPNILISVAGRLEEYQMGMSKLQSSNCHNGATSGSETDPGLRTKNANKMRLGRNDNLPLYIVGKPPKYFLL